MTQQNGVAKVKVSVIVPAYNCEKIIGDTIKSVLTQRLTEIEVIILNDGSTDNTLGVIEALTASDKRVKVISLINGGPAKARNVGINHAIGEYICFLDSDDLIAPDMLIEMYDKSTENQLDVCACGYQMETVVNDRTSVKTFKFPEFIATNKDSFRDKLMPLIKAHMMYVVWNKLFRRMFILENQIRFTDFLSGEDRLFNIQTFKHIERFAFVDKAYYRYFMRGKGSLANKYISNRFEATLKAHLDLILAYKSMELFNSKNKKYIEFVFIKGVMACFSQMFLPACPLNKAEKLNYIKTTIDLHWVTEAVQSHDEEFLYSKYINRALRKGNVKSIYNIAKFIHVMQTKFNNAYQRIKHNRKKT